MGKSQKSVFLRKKLENTFAPKEKKRGKNRLRLLGQEKTESKMTVIIGILSGKSESSRAIATCGHVPVQLVKYTSLLLMCFVLIRFISSQALLKQGLEFCWVES